MEVLRTRLVVAGRVPANGFDPGNSQLSPFMQRLARAHANCLEGLPIFGGLLLLAVVAGRSAVTDPLALVLLAARLLQSVVHLISTFAARRQPALYSLRGADLDRRLPGHLRLLGA
ncbi:MAG: MAPEG family protein [Burkholderiaceae bacterium]